MELLQSKHLAFSPPGGGDGYTLAALPASDKPVSESTLKQMLLSLKRDIQADLHRNLATLNTQIELVEERTDHVERKIGEFADTINDLVDGHTDDIKWLKDKVDDLKDRSIRNNLKLRGVP